MSATHKEEKSILRQVNERVECFRERPLNEYISLAGGSKTNICLIEMVYLIYERPTAKELFPFTLSSRLFRDK